MKKIDRLLRSKLLKEAAGYNLEETGACLSGHELSCYITGKLEQQKRSEIEKHLADCFLCLDKAVSAFEGTNLLKKRKLKSPPRDALWKARNIERISDEFINSRINTSVDSRRLLPRTQKTLHAKKAVIGWLPKNLRKNRWLIASITAFSLSFAFPPVFLQFLLAAGILGGKWIFDSENARTLIMIYNAWKKGDQKEAGNMIESLKDRVSKG